MAGWIIGGEGGTKVVAYLFGVMLVLVSGWLARRWLSWSWTLLSMIFVSLFQVVTWQSSSVYVDLIKATWELLALQAMLSYLSATITTEKSDEKYKMLYLSWFGLGASLATKLFSILLVPLWSWWLFWGPRLTLRNLIKSSLAMLMLPLPFYGWAYIHTGNPFLSLFLHTQKVQEIGGESTLSHFIFKQFFSLWQAPWQLLISRDYTNWLLVLFLPLLLWQLPHLLKRLDIKVVISFIGYQWLVWWFVPPLSTRYALSGFIMMMIVMVKVMSVYWERSNQWRIALVLTLLLSFSFHLAPRLVVLKRQLPYIKGTQSKTEYLQQFYDGSIDSHLKKWHQL